MALRIIEELLQVAPRTGFVEAAHIERPACGWNRRQAAACQLSLELLDPDAPARHDFPVILGPVRSAAPLGLAGSKAHPRGRAAVEPDQDQLVAVPQVLLDQRRDGLRQTPAMGSISRG